jgi:hypothetical protein
MNQLEEIRHHLLKTKSITSWEEIQSFRCTRLSQYILLLRQEGYEIISEWQHNENRRWVKYTLIAITNKEGQMVLV